MSKNKKHTEDQNTKVENKDSAINVDIEAYNELENRYKRVLADYQNLVNRNEIEKEKTIKYANERLLKSLLVILDDLNESFKYSNDPGIFQIIQKYISLLNKEGVTSYCDVNDDFDPNLHEAIESISGPLNKIIKVHQKGYKFDNKTIRPAMVSVGNGNK